MPLLTVEQLQEIRKIIEDHHDAFVVNTIGADAVPADVLTRLREKGLVNAKVESVKDAYIYGQLLSMLESDRIAKMSYEEFKAHLKRNPVPLSASEMHAIQMAQQVAGASCKGLGNVVSRRSGGLMIEADAGLRASTEGIIRDATALNIARRETVSRLKSDLGWATEDWNRDWTRIAVTEKQNAMQHGVADHYRKEYGGDVLVAKRAMPDACKHCDRLHNGPDGHPRIFKLSDLEGNGTNIGRKAAEWLPVVGTVHPHCQCQMIRVPEGWGFDEHGDLVPAGEFGKHYDGPEDVFRSMQLEDELQKAFRLQGHVNFRGLPIAIENKAGSVRTWEDGQGGSGQTQMLVGYGYIKRTNGTDEDEIDAFVGPDPKSEMVYVIEQQLPKEGRYDEQKCMIGFPNQTMAEEVYQAHFDRPDYQLYTTAMTLDQFKRWIQETQPTKGEMMKAQDSKYRLVIPLSKARVATVVGAATSQAGNRNPSQFGTSPNYIMQGVPERPTPESLADVGYSPDPRGQVEDAFYEGENPLKVDKEVYDFPEHKRIVRPLVIPEEMAEAQEQAREGSDDRMRYLLNERVINAPRPKNEAEVPHAGLQKSADRSPTVNKKGDFNVIAVGPRGGKIIGYSGGKPIYLHSLDQKEKAALKAAAKESVAGKRKESLKAARKSMQKLMDEARWFDRKIDGLDWALSVAAKEEDYPEKAEALTSMIEGEMSGIMKKYDSLISDIKKLGTAILAADTSADSDRKLKEFMDEGVKKAEEQIQEFQKSKADRDPTLNKQGQFNVVAIGPRGGKIVGYKNGKPIYLHKLTGRAKAAAKKQAQVKQGREQVTPKRKPKRKPVPKKTDAQDVGQVGKTVTPPKTPPKGAPGVFNPDPTPPKGGIAKAARVGVPAANVPPPPSIPRLPNLTPEEREIETKFIEAFEKDPDGFAQAFFDMSKDNDFIFETDMAKALMPEWSRPDLPPDKPGEPIHPERAKARAKYNTVLHQVANAIAKRAFVKRLDEIAKMPEDQRAILVTSGGVAGGKGSALKAKPELAQSVAATWDAAGEQNATENEWLLEECEKRGIKPTFLFVSADPEKTWGGAIARAKSIGRMVDARVFSDSYAHGAKNFKAFYDKNKGKVTFVLAQAGTWDPATKTVSPAQFIDDIPQEALDMDAEALYKKAMAVIESQKADLPPHIVAGATSGVRIWKPGMEVAP